MASNGPDPALLSEARRRVRMKTGLKLQAAAFVLTCSPTPR
jgi:hypothetical protein